MARQGVTEEAVEQARRGHRAQEGLAMTYRRSGSLWSLLRAIFTARAAGRRRRPRRYELRRIVRRALRRWLR